MSLLRMTVSLKIITFFLSFFITQITLGGTGNPNIRLKEIDRGVKPAMVENTWPEFATNSYAADHNDLPRWIQVCDSLNKILSAPLCKYDVTNIWQPAYDSLTAKSEEEAISRFMAGYFFLEVNAVYYVRDNTVAVYQALESITFQVGFDAFAGDEFTAEVIGGIPSGGGSTNSDMNWIMSKSFDENGNVIGESKQFFDKTGLPLQTQAKVLYRGASGATSTQVFASQPLRDALGREVATTMAAPISNSEFQFKPDFVLNSNGTTYDYRNFDRFNETDKTNNPDPIGGQNIPGSLGWYYSSNNILEPYTPTTNYPYSRQTIYNDGTGALKRSAGAGEVFKMGSGHEVSSYATPVISELDHYLQVRNRFFSAAEVGATPATLRAESIQAISNDANGKMGIAIQDKRGKVLMSARPGNDLTVSNSVNIRALPHVLNFPAAPSGGGCGWPNTAVKITGSGSFLTLTNPANSTFTIAGPLNKTEVLITSSDWGSVIRSDAPFTITYDDRQGGSCEMVAVTLSSQDPGSNDVPLHYFKIFADNSDVSITGNYTLIDMNTEAATTLLPGNKLNKGFYRLQASDNYTSVTLTYINKYTDVSYNFYNQLGQLVATVAPEGVKKLLNGGLNNYSTKNDVPFLSLFEYDEQGRLVKTTSTDGGAKELIYRKDGKVRFSQNAEQRSNGRYSYINYDQFGRPIESGEYKPETIGIPFNSDLTAASPMKSILEDVSATGGLINGTKKDVIMTLYDVPEGSHGQNTYVQNAEYLGGTVSMTRKYSSISNNTPSSGDLISSNWYNYDEEGKVVWSIQYIKGLGYKTTDYSYDVQGRLVKKDFQKGATGTERFIHYYDYDPVTQSLWKVSTSVDDITKIPQATYKYYLHGPLKRVELATDLQGLDYTYTLQGQLKAINNSNKAKDPGGDGSSNAFFADAFGMVLDYHSGDYQNGRPSTISQPINGVQTTGIGSVSYGGNIKAMTWFSKKPIAAVGSNPAIEDPITYVYEYDDKYQFTESTWGKDIDFSNTPAGFTPTGLNKETVKNPANGASGYDANGNILYLQRTDGSGALSENFTYNYLTNTNKLSSVVHNASNAPETYAQYTYNQLGQLTGETNTFKGINRSKYIEYDVYGKVVAVYRDADKTQLVVEYVYDERGERIIKKSYATDQLSQITYYAGSVIYTQLVTNGTPGPITPQEYGIEGAGGRLGTFYRPMAVYAYELNDHLGNVRAVVAKSSSTLEVRMYTDYYPYGATIGGNPSDYRHGYQGQYAEKDGETDWNAFELRMYDSKIARWMQYDPKGEFWSPYVGMGNDPVNNIDRDGGCTDCVEKAQKFANEVGGKIGIDPFGRWSVSYTKDGQAVTKFFGNKLSDEVMSRIRFDALVAMRSLQVKSGYNAEVKRRVEFAVRSQAQSFSDMLLLSRYQRKEVTFGGEAFEKFNNDPVFKAFEKRAYESLNLGKESVHRELVGFGGERGSWLGYVLLLPTTIDAYSTTFDELTWMVRNVWVTATSSMVDGKLAITYSFADKFDLVPGGNRGAAYNIVTAITGAVYHKMMGNTGFKVSATWTNLY